MDKPGGWSDETFRIVKALRERLPRVSIQETDYGYSVHAIHPRERLGVIIQQAPRKDRGREHVQMSMEALEGAVKALS